MPPVAARLACGARRARGSRLGAARPRWPSWARAPGRRPGPSTCRAPPRRPARRCARRASAGRTTRPSGARALVPASLEEARVWGTAPGGGVRAIVAGLRLVSSPAGDVVAATDRLPGNPSPVCELPERLGGGFLMALGAHLWSAQDVARASRRPSSRCPRRSRRCSSASIASTSAPPRGRSSRSIRARVRWLDLGPLPPSPRVASIAALDAWRAVAVADLRGVLLTLDAGSSWRPVALPIEPARAMALDEAFAVGGLDRTRTMQWWAVLPEGQTGWLASPPAPTMNREQANDSGRRPDPAAIRAGAGDAPRAAAPRGRCRGRVAA